MSRDRYQTTARRVGLMRNTREAGAAAFRAWIPACELRGAKAITGWFTAYKEARTRPRLKWSNEQKAEFIRLWNEGTPTMEIAKRFGFCSTTAVGLARKRLKLPARRD
jgi:hypothetical protein